MDSQDSALTTEIKLTGTHPVVPPAALTQDPAFRGKPAWEFWWKQWESNLSHVDSDPFAHRVARRGGAGDATPSSSLTSAAA